MRLPTLKRPSDPKIERLREVGLFAGCDPDELAVVASTGDLVHVGAGRVLTQEGRRGAEFDVILDGEAVVLWDERQVARLGPGSFFGEVSLLALSERSATVVADTPMTLLAFSKRDFNRLLDGAPTVVRRMLREMATRFRDVRDLDREHELGRA